MRNIMIITLAALMATPALARAKKWDEQYPMRPAAVELDQQIDWSAAALLAVQDAGRYKTLDSFARESMSAMTGHEHLPQLSPLASLCEWLFNRDQYADAPLIRIKDQGLRINFTTQWDNRDERNRVLDTGYFTLREMFDPQLRNTMSDLETRSLMLTAMRRARNAEVVAKALNRMIRLVPQPGGAVEDAWFTPDELRANLPEEYFAKAGLDRQAVLAQNGGMVPGVTAAQAEQVLARWAALREGWLRGDAAAVQDALNKLAAFLPTMAAENVYPTLTQRQAEAQYYRFGKFTWGWVLYFLAALISIPALVTRWKTPWIAGISLLVIAMGFHAYGIGLRWYILGRIPVANMFEAVVASALLGIALGLVVELIFRTRVFLVASCVTGFFALVLGQFIIPGGGTLTSIMGILDDVMLRIHTVLIIASYALIFLAAVIAVIYLFGYYFIQAPQRSIEAGLTIAVGGAALWVLSATWVYQEGVASSITGIQHHAAAMPLFMTLLVFSFLGLCLLGLLPTSVRASFGLTLGTLLLVSFTLALTPKGFAVGLGQTMLGTGMAWSVFTLLGLMYKRSPSAMPAVAMAGAGAPALAAAPVGGELFSTGDSPNMERRPVLAGGAPGDDHGGSGLPPFLNHIDWSHLIILNLVFVMLFVGIILGAVWADYSWGRPWGWDPKEVFALNTWLVYAVLIHVRFVVKRRGLWTAWLSVLGCLMMAFNWCFVNFFIVGLHSYA